MLASRRLFRLVTRETSICASKINVISARQNVTSKSANGLGSYNSLYACMKRISTHFISISQVPIQILNIILRNHSSLLTYVTIGGQDM